MTELINLTGKLFGRLLVIQVASRGGRYVMWRCRCSCGTEIIVQGKNLRNGNTLSCGCLNKEIVSAANTIRNFHHGHSMRKQRSRTYISWANMIQRCTNPNNGNYSNYGGRGVYVCMQWMNFDNFLADMGEAPKGMQIERKNNNGNYEPNNCRWATRDEQMNNMTTNRSIIFNDITHNLAEWAQITGIPRKTISQRLDRGWSVERSLFTKQGVGSNQYTSKPL